MAEFSNPPAERLTGSGPEVLTEASGIVRDKVIPRRKAEDDPCSFISLRREGIRYVQQFSGTSWTDYNLHDPGVTILEQLCFSLTDLAYRTDFSVADLLSDAQGTLDLQQAGLELPEAILPSRACTLSDFNRLLLDQLEEVEQVRLIPCIPGVSGPRDSVAGDNETVDNEVGADGAVSYMGLYDLELHLNSRHQQLCQKDPQQAQRIIDKAHRRFTASRNLCEDIARIRIAGHHRLQLQATIELDTPRDPHDVLADIYMHSLKWLKGESIADPVDTDQGQPNTPDNSDASYSSYSSYSSDTAGKRQDISEDSQEIPLDQRLSGPLTRFMPVSDDISGQASGASQADSSIPSDRSLQPMRSLSGLYAVVSGVSGVARIHQLTLDSGEGSGGASEGAGLGEELTKSAWLALPEREEDIQIRLIANGHPLTVHFSELTARLEQRQFRHQALRRTWQDTSALYSVPSGRWRSPGHYLSIQDHFPACYQLSVQGIPVAMGQGDKARVLQLRGYLLLFDQMMANFCANLEGLRELFSVRIHHRQSYHFARLDEQSFRGVTQLYSESADQPLDTLLSGTDHYAERKGRLLDYLLALYGEQLDDRFFRRFNVYDTELSLDNRLLEYKSEFIQRIATLTRDRAGGYDYLSADLGELPADPDSIRPNQSKGRIDQHMPWQTPTPGASGFQQRIALLLGMTEARHWPISGAIAACFKWVPETDFLQVCQNRHCVVSQERIEGQLLQSVPSVRQSTDSENQAASSVQQILSQITVLQDGNLCDAFLHQAIQADRFRLLKTQGRSEYQLLFRFSVASTEDVWLLLADRDTQPALEKLANQLWHCLIQLNRQSEGLYAVEHLLLRPLSHQGIDEGEDRDGDNETDGDIYSFRVSVILPGFTVRCADPAFRREAQQMIVQQCPAHIVPEFHWLSFDALRQFETLYQHWMLTRQDQSSTSRDNQQAAYQLMQFLQASRSDSPRRAE